MPWISVTCNWRISLLRYCALLCWWFKSLEHPQSYRTPYHPSPTFNGLSQQVLKNVFWLIHLHKVERREVE
jgi:hypothetical protein